MALENKLNITDSTELARMEEKISKKKAVEMCIRDSRYGLRATQLLTENGIWKTD